jgi:hypothetical protein
MVHRRTETIVRHRRESHEGKRCLRQQQQQKICRCYHVLYQQPVSLTFIVDLIERGMKTGSKFTNMIDLFHRSVPIVSLWLKYAQFLELRI